MNYKTLTWIGLSLIMIYILLSLLFLHGELMPIHYYSYENMKECKEKETFVSNDIVIHVEGDSLVQTKNLSKKFYICKSMYEHYYGFLIHTNNEDKNHRRIKWEESLTSALERNWIIVYNGEYLGDAFYFGFLDAKIGDAVELLILNKKTDEKIGNIKLIVK